MLKEYMTLMISIVLGVLYQNHKTPNTILKNYLITTFLLLTI